MAKNLVPERRQDRNGKSVLRWVLDDTRDSQGRKLPPVQLAEKQRQNELMRLIFPDDSIVEGEFLQRKAVAYLQEELSDLIPRIVEAMHGDEDVAINLRSVLHDPMRLTRGDSNVRSEFEGVFAVHAYTKRLIASLGLGDDNDDEGYWMRDVMFHMDVSVQEAREIEARDDDITKATIMVLMMEGHHNDDSEATARETYLQYEDEIEYIAENLEAVEAIAPELMRRNSYDKSIIKELLSGPSKSLTSGML